jgi:predicted HicB family RNase H-like nuclease
MSQVKRTRFIGLRVPEEVYDFVKVQARKNGLTMTQFVEQKVMSEA